VRLPIVDIAPLRRAAPDRVDTARRIGEACRQSGFFYARGHGIDPNLIARLDAQARRFFASDLCAKLEIAMERGGRAWRGYFPVGAELTAGQADNKEGIYFGVDLPADHPRVRSALPLHGANLYPAGQPELRAAVDEYMAALSALANAIMEGIALSLGLPAATFALRYTREPLILFRIFHYPAAQAGDPGWGVGEHTDYGFLTILRTDDAGGLQVKAPSGWIDVPPVPGAFVCNIGDMLERITGGFYRSTPHRVRNTSGAERLSFAFFFDPDYEAEVAPLRLPSHVTREHDRAERWDGESVHDAAGTYGEYLLRKVGRVFPELRRSL